MSTFINGYVVEHPIEETYNLLETIRIGIAEKADEILRKSLIDIATDLVDTGVAQMGIIQQAFKKWKKEQNTQFHLRLYPSGDRTYFIPDSNHVELRDSLSIDWISEYRFWDNADPPDDVDDQEWESRRQVWDSLLYKSGLRYTLVPERYYAYFDHYLDLIPTREERAYRLARLRVIAQNMKHNTIDEFYKAQRFVEKHPEEIDFMASNLIELLPEITKDML